MSNKNKKLFKQSSISTFFKRPEQNSITLEKKEYNVNFGNFKKIQEKDKRKIDSSIEDINSNNVIDKNKRRKIYKNYHNALKKFNYNSNKLNEENRNNVINITEKNENENENENDKYIKNKEWKNEKNISNVKEMELNNENERIKKNNEKEKKLENLISNNLKNINEDINNDFEEKTEEINDIDIDEELNNDNEENIEMSINSKLIQIKKKFGKNLKDETKTNKEKKIVYTPLEQQYLEIKKNNQDKLLAFEVGYKYRFFENDAVVKNINMYTCIQYIKN